MKELQKVGIVTGGASGIGRAISKELASKGVYVVIADRNQIEGELAAEEIALQGGKARFVPVDVTVADSVQNTVHEVYKEFGRLDYMFNNAGVTMYGELQHTSLEHWKKIVDIIYGALFTERKRHIRS